MSKTSIIIPTYNEAENIKILIPKIKQLTRKLNIEIIVVDDNSPDGTYKVAKKLATKAILRTKRGLATAVIEGFRHASGNIIIVMDADLSHPPELIPKLIKAMDNHLLAIATRKQTKNWPLKRKITSTIATSLARPLTKAKDPMSGFFALKKSAIPKNLKPLGYKILLELIVRSNIKNYVEIPFIFKDRELGKSKLTIKTNLRYLQHLQKLYLYKLKINILNL